MNDKPIKTIFLVEISARSIIYTLMAIATLIMADIVFTGALNVISISLYVAIVIMFIVYMLLYRKQESYILRIKIEK